MKKLIKIDDPWLFYSAGLALLLNLIIEGLGRQSLWKGIEFFYGNPRVFLYNTFFIFVTLSFSLMLRRRLFYHAVLSVLWLMLGITNGVILSFRMTPFTVSDLALLENGLSILPNYMSTWQIILLGAGIMVLISAFILTFIFAPKKGTCPNIERAYF